MKSQARIEAQQDAFRKLYPLFCEHVEAMKVAALGDADAVDGEIVMADTAQLLVKMLWLVAEWTHEEGAPQEAIGQAVATVLTVCLEGELEERLKVQGALQ